MKLDPNDPELLRETSKLAGRLVERSTTHAADLEACRSIDPVTQSQGLEAIADLIDAARSLQTITGRAASAKEQEPS